MTVTSENIKERARELLPYFQDARGDSGDPATGSDKSDVTREDFPPRALRLEEAARSETKADWNEKYFYGLVAETLMDVEEYGEHRWEEYSISPENMIDEIASDISVSAFYEELFEWANQSSDWSDVAEELRNKQADDGKRELELMQEGMGNDIYRIRRVIISELYEQLIEEDEGIETS